MRRGSDLSFELFREGPPRRRWGGDGGEHRRLLRALELAVRCELTARQRECLRLYYQEGETVTRIAERLGVGAPTVSRHLKKARARLRKAAGYCAPRLERPQPARNDSR